MSVVSLIMALIVTLLLLFECLSCIHLKENAGDFQTFISIVLCYAIVFMSFLALMCAVIAIIKIRYGKNHLTGMKQAIYSICITIPCLMVWYALFINIIAPTREVVICKITLRNITTAISSYTEDHNKQYPAASKWCDLLLSEGYISNKLWLKCPNEKLGACSYAFNEEAYALGRGVPYSMVLMFESKPGWNQIGGQELLNVDNHEGRGACIAYGDYRIEFVSREKLNKLRWDKEKVKIQQD